MTTPNYKTEDCPFTSHFMNDLYFCKCNHDCEYRITVGQGRYHHFCFLRLDGVREMARDSELEGKARNSKDVSIRDFIKRFFKK